MGLRYYGGVATAVAVLVAAGGLWRFGTSSPKTNASPSRPNVVLISLDTTRPDHLGCYGYSRPTSPNLDRLASGGVRFANTQAQAPWTLPSHMTLFTSLVPSHHQMYVLSVSLSPEIPMLAEILRDEGYNTAGLVNDAQIKSTWGFHRGFELWEELHHTEPTGDCIHVTDRALRWLDAVPQSPFFLFLHYYDPHDPYDPPEEFRRRFGASLSGAENSEILRRFFFPQTPIRDRAQFDQVIAAYDGEIAWLDNELGRLLSRLPANTLVVIFSDHGEAFKEHGWTKHGGSLYEEEIHTVLLLSLPGVLPEGRVVKEPTMLLDVAPTILQLCGIPAPAHYEGLDLSPTWTGGHLPERPIVSEVFATFHGTAGKSVAINDWKLIRSLLDGREELYHLPDEQTDLSQNDTTMRQALSQLVRRWIAEEDFWTLYASGPGEFTAVTVPRSGQIPNIIPLRNWQADGAHDRFENEAEGRILRWTCRPGDHTKGVLLQVMPRDAPIGFDLRVDGRPVPAQVFIGSAGTHPAQIPFTPSLEDATAKPSVIEEPFHAAKQGFYVFHHGGRASPGPAPARGITLDDRTIQQLRTLGYLR